MRYSKFIIPLFVSLVLVPVYFASAITAKDFSADKTPTPAQIKEFEALPEGERNKIIQELLKKAPLTNVTQVTPQTASELPKGAIEKVVFATTTTSTFPVGTVNCFDYYHFQSVQVNLKPVEERYAPNDKAVFKGEIINQNTYPVVDSYVFARIAKKNPNYLREGDYIVDEIVPLQKITLAAKETKAASFEWIVPKDAEAGEYSITYFYSVGKKFNLGGLPFTNEIIIGTSNFRIEGFTQGSVYFDRSKTTVNGTPYAHIGSTPFMEKETPVSITQDIKNTSSKPQQVTVVYDLFWWDSLNEADKRETKSETVTVPAQSSAALSYNIPKPKEVVSYVRITAISETQKSIVNVRFVQAGEHPRLNYPALTEFPLLKGVEASLFTCFHNTTFVNSLGSVNVAIYDKRGKEIGRATYQGSISGQMVAIAEKVIPQKDYSFLKLKAEVKDSFGGVTDIYETTYDCKEINSVSCKILLEKEARAQKILNLLLIVGPVSLVIVGVVIRKRKSIINLV